MAEEVAKRARASRLFRAVSRLRDAEPDFRGPFTAPGNDDLVAREEDPEVVAIAQAGMGFPSNSSISSDFPGDSAMGAQAGLRRRVRATIAAVFMRTELTSA